MLVSTMYSFLKCNCSASKLSLLSPIVRKRNELLEAMTHHKPEHLLYSFWNVSLQDLEPLLQAGPPFCWSHPQAVGSSGLIGTGESRTWVFQAPLRSSLSLSCHLLLLHSRKSRGHTAHPIPGCQPWSTGIWHLLTDLCKWTFRKHISAASTAYWCF